MSGTDWLQLAFVVVLILVVAVMAASETAIVRMNRVRAYHLGEDKKRGAASLIKIVEKPAPYLNVVLLLTLIATIGGTTIATSLAVRHFHRFGEIISTVIMTLLLFIFAEVTPKTFAVQHTDRVALRFAPLLVWLGRVFGPIARGLLGLTNVLLPGKGLPQGPFITEQEIKTLAEMASEEKEIEEDEKELIHSVFEFGDTIAREVMVPRPDIVAIDAAETLRDVQALVLQHGNSRIPVYREDLDDVIGIVFAKDVLKALHQGKNDMPLTDIIREAHFIPESKKCTELLKQMQKEKFHIALVTDEYGSVAGLVTLEDLLEELVGEIEDEYDLDEPEIVELGEGSYRASGKASIDDINDILGIELPDDEWDTLGGLVMGLIGEIPDEGQDVKFQGLTFVAERVQGRRIATVMITQEPADEPPLEAVTE